MFLDSCGSETSIHFLLFLLGWDLFENQTKPILLNLPFCVCGSQTCIIVNTIAENLNLKQGAVAKALLQVTCSLLSRLQGEVQCTLVMLSSLTASNSYVRWSFMLFAVFGTKELVMQKM